ncbi:MAG: hypothetical protein SVQ76_01755, partial [Candidatus Nanohaloarchaea archaeon]|nr:hypothetical protein [Candidatus Nanohaloarchaea archaeon]
MQRRRRLLLLASVLPTFLVVVSASAAALSPLDVLLVSDGHTLKDPAATPDDRFVPRYRKAIESLDNVDVDVYHTNASGPIKGPSARKMDDYDVVVWYTLQDFEGNPSSLCSSNGVCTTFHGDASNPDSGGGDVQNITTYLQDYRGRMFVTGQRVHFKNKRTEFEQKVFEVVHGTTERELYECKPQGFWYECESVSKSEMNNVLMGEQKDPVTRDEFFRPSMDTSIEPEGQRGIFLADESSPIADDDFRWRHPKEENDRFYAVDTDGDGDLEDYTHSMVRTNKSSYKTVYAGFGFEAIESSSARRKLMNWTLHYLAGPRVDATVVQDASTTDYPEYTNGNVDVSATCLNRQIQTGTKVSDAEMLVEQDTGIQDPRLKNGNYPMTVDDRSFDEGREPVSYSGYDAPGNIDVSLTNYPEGYNQSYGVHCRDSSDQGYWGQFGKDWVIVDTVEPVEPDSVSFQEDYTRKENATLTVNYRKTSDGYMADLVRFSCSSSGSWSDWRVYDPSKAPGTSSPDEKNFEINLTDTSIGCAGPGTDGNRTVYVDARDYAGNTAGTTASDWIVLDRDRPTFRSVSPANKSYIQVDDLLRINATDDHVLSDGVEAPNNTFYNGTLNQTFVPNSSFDPDYFSEGSKTLV